MSLVGLLRVVLRQVVLHLVHEGRVLLVDLLHHLLLLLLELLDLLGRVHSRAHQAPDQSADYKQHDQPDCSSVEATFAESSKVLYPEEVVLLLSIVLWE